MKSNLLWLVGIIVLVALGAWISRERSMVGEAARPGLYVPTEAEKAEAQKILRRSDLPQAENERRLVFYNDLRDTMDRKAYGVLEAVASELRGAPGNRVSLGYDLKCFYSAVGGDRDFKGNGDEDWVRLITFSSDWLKAIPGSVTARIAGAQAWLEGLVGPPDPAVRAALAKLPDAGELVPMDAHEVKMLNWLSYQLCLRGSEALAREAFRKLGSNVDWRGLPQAPLLEDYRKWAEGQGPRPESQPARGK